MKAKKSIGVLLKSLPVVLIAGIIAVSLTINASSQNNNDGESGTSQNEPVGEAPSAGGPGSGGPPEQPPASVVTDAVREGAFAQPLRLTGNVEPWEETTLSAEQSGIVEEIIADEGEFVKKGQPLMRLRQLPLELNYKRADAEARREAETLRRLKTGSRTEEVAIAKANWEEARIKAEIAKREYDRYSEMLEDKTVSRSEYDERLSTWENARAMEEVMRANYDLALEGSRQEDILAQEAEVESLRADADLARDQLERSTLRAPYDGVVTRRYISPGSWVNVGTPLYEFEQNDRVKVTVSIPERHFTDIEMGMELEVSFDAIPKKVFEGQVTQVIPRADIRSRSFPIKIALDNSEKLLATGMLGRTVLQVGNTGERSIIVPKDALVPMMPQPVVYRVAFRDGKPFAESVPVDTGRFFGEAVEVFGELEPGQQVVIRGNERLQPGQPLILNQFITNQNMANTMDPSRFFNEDFSHLESEPVKAEEESSI